MKDYLLVLLSVVLLAASFMLQKLYQKKTVSDPRNGVKFSLCSAVISLLLLFFTGGMQLQFSWYSIGNAALRALAGFLYTLLGFRILKRGNVALYMLFLMSGGMLVPCVWGWLFLGEAVTPLRAAGVVVILASIVLSNSGLKRPDTRLLLLCVAVFFLNGAVSVLSKLHQANTTYPVADTNSYAIYGTLASLLMSSGTQVVSTVRERKKEAVKPPAGVGIRLLPLLLVLLYSAVGTASSVLQLEGARNLPASVLYPMITGGSIALSGVFARICFKEKLSLREWAGIVLCLGGTCLFL